MWLASPAAMAATLSRGKWNRAPHIDLLSGLLGDAAYGETPRVIVSEPPRHGKSELVSHWFPVWYLTLNPTKRVILCSYEADFAASWGRRVRNTITEHTERLGIAVAPDSAAANRWDLTAGGGMVTAGVGGPITGKGADLLIIDDPVKNFADAYSATIRETAWNWYRSTARTRLEPGGVIVVVMTRWHEDDLVGRLLAGDGEPWHEVRLPAIAEGDDALGRSEGEPLWPERYDAEALATIEKTVGSLVWAGLYQQRPAPLEGGIVKRAWLQFYDAPPKRFDELIQSWDFPQKGNLDSDYVAGQVWGRLGADCYLLDQVRGRMDFPAMLKAFEALTLRWPQAHRKLVEDAAAGAPLVSTLRSKIAGIVPVTARASKEARLASVSSTFEAGNVHLPKHTAWTEAYIDELVTFPGAKNDDQVDATSQALARLSNSALERLRRLASR